MKHLFISLIFAAVASFSAGAGIITGISDSVAAVDGVSFIDGSDEAKKKANVDFAKIYIVPADKAADVSALLGCLSEDMMVIDVAEEDTSVKMWVEPVNETIADVAIYVVNDKNYIAIFMRGNLNDIKNNIHVGVN